MRVKVHWYQLIRAPVSWRAREKRKRGQGRQRRSEEGGWSKRAGVERITDADVGSVLASVDSLSSVPAPVRGRRRRRLVAVFALIPSSSFAAKWLFVILAIDEPKFKWRAVRRWVGIIDSTYGEVMIYSKYFMWNLWKFRAVLSYSLRIEFGPSKIFLIQLNSHIKLKFFHG